MGLFGKIQEKTGEARARERVRPLLESRMMRDILLEIGQRGSEPLDLQSVPLAQRGRAAKLAAETGVADLKQSVIGEVILDEAAITLMAGDEPIVFRYSDYNCENIENTDYLPAVAQYLVQHMRGYYNISRTFSMVPKANNRGSTEKTQQVFIRRHHEEEPFNIAPAKKKYLF